MIFHDAGTWAFKWPGTGLRPSPALLLMRETGSTKLGGTRNGFAGSDVLSQKLSSAGMRNREHKLSGACRNSKRV